MDEMTAEQVLEAFKNMKTTYEGECKDLDLSKLKLTDKADGRSKTPDDSTLVAIKNGKQFSRDVKKFGLKKDININLVGKIPEFPNLNDDIAIITYGEAKLFNERNREDCLTGGGGFTGGGFTVSFNKDGEMVFNINTGSMDGNPRGGLTIGGGNYGSNLQQTPRCPNFNGGNLGVIVGGAVDSFSLGDRNTSLSVGDTINIGEVVNTGALNDLLNLLDKGNNSNVGDNIINSIVTNNGDNTFTNDVCEKIFNGDINVNEGIKLIFKEGDININNSITNIINNINTENNTNIDVQQIVNIINKNNIDIIVNKPGDMTPPWTDKPGDDPGGKLDGEDNKETIPESSTVLALFLLGGVGFALKKNP